MAAAMETIRCGGHLYVQMFVLSVQNIAYPDVFAVLEK